MRWSLLLAAAAVVVTSCNVGQVCTLVGCSSGVSVTLTSSAWQDGDYTLELTSDGQREQCSFRVPTIVNVDSSVPVSCSGGSSRVWLDVNGRDAHQIVIHASVAAEPKVLGLGLSRDGSVVFTHSDMPSYVTSQPNGPDCEPTCRSATLEFSVDG